MFPNGAFPIATAQHLMPRDVVAHDHDFFEIALVTEGAGIHLTASGDHRVGPGSVVLIPPNQWHGYADCEDLVVFDCFIGPELFDGIISFATTELTLVSALTDRSFPAPQRVELSAESLPPVVADLEQLTGSTVQSHTSRIGHLLLCLDALDRAWEPTAEHRRSAGRLHPAVTATSMQLEQARERAWTLSELAEAAAVERSHLVRLFQRDLGISPIAYLNQLRAQEAARLLVQTDQPVARIGAQVGWDDAAHFARRFKAAYGLSPSQYRQRALKGDAGH